MQPIRIIVKAIRQTATANKNSLTTHLCRLPYPSVSRPTESPTTMPGITTTSSANSPSYSSNHHHYDRKYCHYIH